METDRRIVEPLSIRQELLNRIYDQFLSFTLVDFYHTEEPKNKIKGKPIKKPKVELVGARFVYNFPEGTTTPGYSDQLSGTYSFKDQQVFIFYAKVLTAGRMTLKKNPEPG